MTALLKFALISFLATNIFVAVVLPLHAQSDDRQLVVVAGGSGRTGSFLMELLEKEGFHVRGLTRNAARARREVSGNHEWVEVDVRNIETLRPALKDADFVISAITGGVRSGPNSAEFVDYGGVKNLVDVALENNVQRFVLISSIKATVDDPENRMNKQRSNLLIWKFRGEEHLRESGLDYTVVRSGGLVTDYKPGTRGLVFEQGDKVYGEIHRADVAAVCLAALEDPAASKKTFELISNPSAPAKAWHLDGFDDLVSDEKLKTPNE